MRPTSPILNFSAGLQPSSPPQTPTAAQAPFFLPKISTRSGPGSGPGGFATQPDPTAPGLQPAERLHHQSSLRPEDLSPCSPGSPVTRTIEPEVGSVSTSPPPSERGSPGPPSPCDSEQDDDEDQYIAEIQSAIQTEFVIEELSDFDEDDMQGRDDVIHPHTIEYAESERSLSRSRLTADDPHMINDLMNLNFCNPDLKGLSSPDSSDLDEDETHQARQRNREKQKQTRMSLSSIGTKRTISELGSDSDHENMRPDLGFEELGSSAKRLKRRNAGDRRSLIYSDPPPRIEEVVEPEELDEALAKELPFYEYTSMEVDSPRSP